MKAGKVRATPTSRSIPEWIGKTPDSIPPPHVLMRIFDHHNGRCHITSREIDVLKDEWHAEHIRSLRDGGENRETNLAPALVEPHKEKTAAERKRGSKADRIREKRLGIFKSKWPPVPGGRKTRFRKPMAGKTEIRRHDQ